MVYIYSITGGLPAGFTAGRSAYPQTGLEKVLLGIAALKYMNIVLHETSSLSKCHY
jgi:hypothetical protein